MCGGAGVPDGCVECGETPRDEPPPDDTFWGDDEPYQWHTGSESWQHRLGGDE